MESVWSVSKLSAESVGSHRELVPNCVHTADATKQFRRVGVGVYWALCMTRPPQHWDSESENLFAKSVSDGTLNVTQLTVACCQRSIWLFMLATYHNQNQ